MVVIPLPFIVTICVIEHEQACVNVSPALTLGLRGFEPPYQRATHVLPPQDLDRKPPSKKTTRFKVLLKPDC